MLQIKMHNSDIFVRKKGKFKHLKTLRNNDMTIWLFPQMIT